MINTIHRTTSLNDQNNIIKKNKCLRILDKYQDNSFIYSVLCSKSSRHFNFMKYLFMIPLIIISSVMSVINSNIDDSNVIKILNTIVNIVTALMLSLNNIFLFEARANEFKSLSSKFAKLSHSIESKLLDPEVEISNDFIHSIIDSYDLIVESIDFDIPNFILKSVHNKYKTLKSLPIICNGIPKSENNIEASISFSSDSNKHIKPERSGEISIEAVVI